MLSSLRAGGTVFWCGNGGSAADSQHFAAELVGRYKRERSAIASVALTTDTSILTAIGNDYSYEEIFARQVEAVVRRGDVLIGISTSGNSQNVIRAVQTARNRGAITIGMLGRDGGSLRHYCENTIVVPHTETARIQEMHLMIGHILCDLVEAEWEK
jgi:D-sedoheptulose 7-phosphate isomerase